ncbi:MAG: hypothetical protein WB041_06730, partial [Pseudolabrys sp.]
METIESAFARCKCALVSSPQFGGTGISGVTAEFLLGEMNKKKRERQPRIRIGGANFEFSTSSKPEISPLFVP